MSGFGSGKGKVDLRNAKGEELTEFVGIDFVKLDCADKLLWIQCRRLTDLLTLLKNCREISVQDRKCTSPSQPYSGVIPHFYGLLKIHKVGVLKIRPIVSNTGIYCDNLLIHLKSILNFVF